MLNFFRQKTTTDPVSDWKAPQPEGPVYAIGDIHGRDDLLARLLDLLDADMTRNGLDAAQVVFLGDYIDRGDSSAQVLKRLAEISAEFPKNVICLRGNHEQMMLDFLDQPVKYGPRWLRNGGLQTLASYGVGGLAERASDEDCQSAAEALQEAIPNNVMAWLKETRHSWQTGDLLCVHASADPALAPTDQPVAALLWGNPDFGRVPRTDKIWVVHGHTVMDDPSCRDGVISIDTGAYFSGHLTAAAIYPGQTPRFVKT